MRTLFVLLSVVVAYCSYAQTPSKGQTQMNQKAPMTNFGAGNVNVDSWQVNVNTMESSSRDRITAIADAMHQQGTTRSAVTDILKASGFGLVSSMVDVVATETINLAKMRKKQKQEWMHMIQNECNYTDSISNIKGLKDFYQEPSRYGALDPSNINFDGISIRGLRNGEEVVYLSCHIDTTRLVHLFQHSKFHLVVDTISFNPFNCHLPNLLANGIKMVKDSERDNAFSYSEREHLTVGLELILSSSWINEAVMVQQDVQLGKFKLQFQIPDNMESFHYSRAEVTKNRKIIEESGGNPEFDHSNVMTEYIEMEGDCFVVPRSYMPISSKERMWGTGEYNIKVKFRESCQFSQDATRNEKMKHWRKDYKQLRKMQKKGSQVSEYFRTVWKQNGDQIVKTMVKQGLNAGVQEAGLSASTSISKSMSGANIPAGAMPANKP